MTREDLDTLGVELMAADDAADPRQLAALAWRLYQRGGQVIEQGGGGVAGAGLVEGV